MRVLLAFVSAILLCISSVDAQTPTKICLKTSNGALTPRVKCKKGETVFSLNAATVPSRIFVVASSGTKYTTLLAARAAAATALPTAQSPVVIKVAPGTYELDSEFILPSFVSIEGSGSTSTVLNVTGATGVSLQANSAVSSLKLSTQSLGFVQMLNVAGNSTRITDVDIEVSGTNATGSAVGILLTSGSVVADRVRMNFSRVGGTASTSIGIADAEAAVTFSGSDLDVTVQDPAAIGLAIAAGSVINIRNSRITVRGEAISSMPARISGSATKVLLQNVTLHNANAVGGNDALYVSESTDVVVEGSRIISEPASFSGGNGVVAADTGAQVQVLNSNIITSSTAQGPAAYSSGTILRIGSSRISGGAATASGGATLTCAGVYDENYVFSASTCP